MTAAAELQPRPSPTGEILDLAAAIPLHFPLRGAWTAFNTPAERIPSHGTDYFGQRYAFDFARVDLATTRISPHGLWRHLLGVQRVEACFGWAEPVLSPFDGRVIARGEDWPDRMRLSLLPNMVRAFVFPRLPTAQDWRPLTGNFLLIEGADGIALLAHMKKGSVRPLLGERVRAGQALGLVGNSGNSMMPHLHFHLMDGPDPFTARGLPAKFIACEWWNEAVKRWESRTNFVPGRLETIRSDHSDGSSPAG